MQRGKACDACSDECLFVFQRLVRAANQVLSIRGAWFDGALEVLRMTDGSVSVRFLTLGTHPPDAGTRLGDDGCDGYSVIVKSLVHLKHGENVGYTDEDRGLSDVDPWANPATVSKSDIVRIFFWLSLQIPLRIELLRIGIPLRIVQETPASCSASHRWCIRGQDSPQVGKE